jgi:hypothetical protein
MQYKYLVLILCMMVSLSVVSAESFTPQGNITLRNVYNIQNATSITIANGTVKANSSGFFGWLNWSWLQNIPNFGNIYVPYQGANQTVNLNNQSLIIQNTKGANVTLNNFVEHTQEMMTDTLLDKSRSTLTATDGILNYTLIAFYGCGQFNFGGVLYPISGSPCVTNATVSLLNGSNILPKTNYVYWELVGEVPTMKTAESPGATGTIEVAEFKVGKVTGSTYNIYSYSRARSEVDTFVNRVLMRFEDMGALYKSGLTITTPNTKQITIGSGYFYNGIFQMFTDITLNSSNATQGGFYWINSTGNYLNASSYDGATFNQYQTGETVTNNRYLNVVWGIVPTSTTGGGANATIPKLVAIIQSKPATEYNTAALAEQDLYSMTNFYPSDVQVKEVFVPVARQVILRTTGGGGAGTAQTLSNGLTYIDIRGRTTSSGGAPTPTTSDHATLTNLDYTNSGHTGFVPYTGATENLTLGNYNISAGNLYTFAGGGYIRDNGTAIIIGHS